MKDLFRSNDKTGPILAPLARARRLPSLRLDRLPPAAAPLAVTLVGAVVLVIAMGAYLSGEAPAPAQGETAAAVETPAARPETPASVDDSGQELAASTASGDETSVASAAPAPDGPDEGTTPVAGDPRWSAEGEGSTAGAAARNDEQTIDPIAEPDATEQLAGSAVALPGADPVPPDGGMTSAIPPALPGAGSFVPNVPVAETDEEIAALEARQQQEVAEDLGSVTPTEDVTASIADAPAGPLRAAIATKYVNLRTGPADEAEVVMVVPALAEIEAEEDCNWCAVAYQGKTGFIYKSFISYQDAAASDPAAAEETPAVVEE